MQDLIKQLRIPELALEDVPRYQKYKLRKLSEKMDYLVLYASIAVYFMLLFHVVRFLVSHSLGELPHIVFISSVVIPLVSKAPQIRNTWINKIIALKVQVLAHILHTAISFVTGPSQDGLLLDPITYPLACLSFVLINCTF